MYGDGRDRTGGHSAFLVKVRVCYLLNDVSVLSHLSYAQIIIGWMKRDYLCCDDFDF